MVSMNQDNKQLVWDMWQQLNHVQTSDMHGVIASAFHPDVRWYGPQPINALDGRQQVIDGFWVPLRSSFPDLKRTTDIFIGGTSDGESWVTATGYFSGTFQNDWLGIPATGRRTYIRFGQFYVLDSDRISESYLILDVLDVMRQAGFQVLPPARGAEGGRVPPPLPNDGLIFVDQDPVESQQTLQLVLAMLNGMRRYDGQSLESMEQHHYWHPHFRWYGPCGIGTSHSLVDYQRFHQGPWIEAFPDRGVPLEGPGRTMGFVAEGSYAAGGIWDRPYATHTGQFLGLAPTGTAFTIRDFDWWRREGNLLVENWVPIDIIDIFKQVGVDLFERMEWLKAHPFPQ